MGILFEALEVLKVTGKTAKIIGESTKSIGESAVKSFSEGLKEGYEAAADDQVREAVAKASEFINGKKKKDDKNDKFSFHF